MLAEEVTQIVFTLLAQAAPKSKMDGQLVAWLHGTTLHAAIDLWGCEMRCQNPEQLAATYAIRARPNRILRRNALVVLLGIGAGRHPSPTETTPTQTGSPAE
jgi:hypothetical protein